MKDLYQVLRIRAATRRTPDKKPTPKRSDVRMLSAMFSSFGGAYVFFFRFSPTVGTFGQVSLQITQGLHCIS